MRRHAWLRALVPLLGVLGFLFVTHLAEARPGGGSSFRGSSRSGGSFSGGSSRSSGLSGGGVAGGVVVGSGGGGMSGGSVMVVFLVIAMVMVVQVMAAKNRNAQGWSAGHGGPVGYEPPRADPAQARRTLTGLRHTDPNFSLVVFEDFLTALYTELLLARGRNELAKFAPYLSDHPLRALQARALDGITHVLVGAMTIEEANLALHDQRVGVTVVVESNLGRRDPATGHEQALYVRERLRLSRAKNARSRTPDKARVFGCPNCGAPLDMVLGGTCRHCQQNVATGAFDWRVDSLVVEESESRGPMLTGTTEEQGNDLPTVVMPGVAQAFQALQQKDPSLDWNGFSARAALIFNTFQTAWAERDLAKMRPFFSDPLFAVQTYWVSEYRRQGLRNITENATVHNLELARVETDPFYDAITVRVWASSLDYTLADGSNKLVAGNRSRPRRYTEYWTFIRSSGAKGPARTDPQCPRCGAPLQINMTGNCTYCQAKVTSGGFDWVLSRIEQDEVYAG